jgi:hypothetical protein
MAVSTRGLAVVRASTTTLDTFQDVLGTLAARYKTDEVLTAIKHLPARAADFRAMPPWVKQELREAYREKGIEQLFSHQAAAADLAHAGRDFVVVTPTASGKTPIPARSTSSPPRRWRRTSLPSYTTSGRGSTIALACSPTTATRHPTRGRRFANAGTWC